ncbi:FKBP-type peptidyl-prolyl cis-trans isomerase [Nocardioides marmoriginsengisoli]|uniref:Peptidyl-prolyl cis-trans isomerase n=1 Tax=Nocardioides marmoriginsengisoli TaxID=661483 RepID=A0A3N0CBR0_9ACTN|nr:FKBP-type peptidyl-prolyl cis-trans isomerase [Nocardioides marmoriginsengisoli]RNL60496.1 FKBP-type peptidyl-prolyl cis-trans isomerase [Nocardioides marmoriginsengisoli]
MFRSRTSRRLLPVAALALALALVLAGCGSDSKDSSDKAEVKQPTDLVLKVIKEGDGATVGTGDSVTVDYQGTNWDTGKVFDESYGKQPATFSTDQVVPGFGAALVGQKVGSQVMVSIPPKYGYGETGNAQAGIKGTDSLLFIVEIKSTKAATLTNDCNFKSGSSSDAIKAAGAFGKVPNATFKKPLNAPGTQRTIMTAGKGAVTKAGDSLDVVLSIYNGRTGKQIDSQQVTLKVGDAALPKQYQAGISCVKIGSRVATAFPAKALFGKTGNAQAGIKAKDSLVLVTDVLNIAKPLTPGEWKDAPSVKFDGSNPPKVELNK